MRTSRLPFALLVTLIGSCITLGPAQGQNGTETISVEDSRPLEAAVLTLLQRHPAIVTYEDSRYQYSGDLQDVSAKNHGTSKQILIPRGGALFASYQLATPEQSGKADSLADAVQSIVDAKNALPLGGRFEVRQSGGILHIVPNKVRDITGRWVEQTSVLDIPISLSTTELDGNQLIETILAKVRETNGAPILGMGAPALASMFAQYKGKVEATDEPARDVLIRALHSISPRLTWIMNYDPTLQHYVFNVAMAAEPLRQDSALDLSRLPAPGAPNPVGIRRQP